MFFVIEKTVISCLLSDPSTHEYINKLTIDDFCGIENRTIFKIIKDLYDSGTTPDYVTVSSKMPWGELSIKTLPVLDFQFMTSNMADYVRELKHHTATRQLQNLIADTRVEIIDGKDIDKIIKGVIHNLQDIDIADDKALVDVGTIEPSKFIHRKKIKSEFKNLDKMIGGFCMGELSVWTGKSGQGKSTFLSQLLLNAINEGYKVCAYSGELINEQFQHWLMLQACGKWHLTEEYDEIKQKNVLVPEPTAIEKIKNWLKGNIFLYNNEFTGRDNNIIDVFKTAYKKYGCTVFLVDNLMTAKYNNDGGNSANYYVQQSNFVGELVRFAKMYDVHVHLVAHPKKSSGELTKEDISGTLDISNRADNTFSVSRDDENGLTLVRILKNRSDGIQNLQVAFKFEPETKRFIPANDDMYKYKKYSWEIEESEPF